MTHEVRIEISTVVEDLLAKAKSYEGDIWADLIEQTDEYDPDRSCLEEYAFIDGYIVFLNSSNKLIRLCPSDSACSLKMLDTFGRHTILCDICAREYLSRPIATDDTTDEMTRQADDRSWHYNPRNWDTCDGCAEGGELTVFCDGLWYSSATLPG